MKESNPLSPILNTLKEDIHVIGSYLRDFSKHVVDDGISEFPVYVAFQEECKIGKAFFLRDNHKLNWNYNVSILEEFVKHNVVKQENVDEFIKAFGDPQENACILVMLPNEASFVFVAYEEL